MFEKFKQYTPEQEEKIKRLREEAEMTKIKNLWNKSTEDTFSCLNPGLKVGDPCFVNIDGSTISGYIMSINDRDRWNKIYDVKTPRGRIIDIPRKNIRRRIVEDYSHVEVPEELKKISTSNLLALLRTSYYSGCSNYCGEYYTKDEIKAELSRRPHIPNKRETKMVNLHKKRKNLDDKRR